MKILVIEDDDEVRKTLEQTLSEEGFMVETAEDGGIGLYKAENWDYDAIILDIALPEVDGWKLLSKLRKNKTTPVLMLTASGGRDDRIRGLNDGADDYLAKPYDPDELVARIRALVRRSTGLGKNKIEIGAIMIDLAAQQVFKNGKPVMLSPAQYKIVEYLARHAGTLVEKTALYECLLMEEEDDFENVFNVHIYNIRKKLGKEFLLNRRGQGYIIPKP